MKAALVIVGTAALGLGGCATVRAGSGAAAGMADPGLSPLHVADARVVEARFNPMAPVQLAAEGKTVAVRLGQSKRGQVVARLDADSLELLSRDSSEHVDAPSTPPTGAARVALDEGRVVVCWTQESGDGGHVALARLWAANGSPLGAPVVISGPDADVLGAPRAVSTDGHHVVVTFAASAGESFELRAVALDDAPTPTAVASAQR